LALDSFAALGLPVFALAALTVLTGGSFSIDVSRRKDANRRLAGGWRGALSGASTRVTHL
jgi:hypothetical protein